MIFIQYLFNVGLKAVHMHYKIEFEFTALIFLLVIVFRFFSKPRFPNKITKMFGIILVCAVADNVLDIIGSYLIEHSAQFPAALNYCVNIIFYSLQLLLPAAVFAYALLIINKKNFCKKYIKLLFLPAAVLELLLLLDPWLHLFFYLNEFMVYTRGPMHISLYLSAGFYMLLTIVYLIINRKDIRKEEYRTFFVLIFFIVVSTVLQYFFPEYLLTGVAISFSLFMMYFTIQNPEDMLDTMTGAFNYSALIKIIKDLMENKKTFQLISIDIQGLRRINSIFGMFVGNQIFVEIFKFLHSLKGKAWIFRKFGTRFVVITYSEQDYKRFISLIEKRFFRPWEVMEMQIMLSAKIRHISDMSEFESAEDVISLLDIAFIEASANNDSPQTAAINVGLLPAERRRIMIETAVKDGLETKKGFTLYFQPIYSVKEKKFTCAEVLLRFEHESLGKISPGEFIPVAEKLGLIFAIDQMVVEKSCIFIKENPHLFVRGLDHININLSAAEFINEELPDKLVNIVRAYNVDPEKIVFEITETVASASHNVLIDCMHKMNGDGFRFALDDFGTGHANIIQVVNLPFYSVKLDRELLDSGFRKNDNMVIFEDTLNMFKRLGLLTVAEGVMTEEQAHYITSLGADYIQGFYYALPMNQKDLTALLHDQQNV